MRWVSALLLLAGILSQSGLRAQRYPFVYYTSKDGLVSTRARYMFQDSKGKLYIATFGGLSIYDGARFTNYTTDNGLADNMVNDVVQMGEDSLWIMPNTNKVHCLVQGRIKDVQINGFCPVINKLIRASNGSFYALADEGLFKLQGNHFEKISLRDATGKLIDKYYSRGCEINGRLFILTDPAIAYYPSPSYLIVYDLASGKVCISKKPPEIYAVAGSPQKDILVATGDGLKTLNQHALQQSEIVFDKVPGLYKNVEHVVASYLYFDSEQNLWLAASDGVTRVDTHGSTKYFSVDNGLPVGLQYSVMQDAECTMWFVNEQTGLSKLSNEHVQFYTGIKPGFSTADLYADNSSDSVWFMDQVRQKILLSFPGGEKEFAVNMRSRWLFRFRPGIDRNYLTGDFEIYEINKQNTGMPRLICSYRDTINGVAQVNNPLTDKFGNLLFTNNNINVVLGKQIVSYPLGYFADQAIIDAYDRAWVITRHNKLFVFHLHHNDPANYFGLLKKFEQEVPDGPRSIAFDRQGNLWMGTRSLGVFCFAVDDTLRLTQKAHYTTKNGLSDNRVIYVKADKDGSVWLCTPVGLDRLQWQNNKWIVQNITLANNIYQNVLRVQTTRSGERWVLTSAGIIKIDASLNETPVNYKPNILFTEIKAGKDTVNMLAGDPSFSYKKNDVFFQWAVPTFIDEKQTLFSYKLQGSDWSELSHEAAVRFVNLSPGKYTLHIKAIFPNGSYPGTTTLYSFKILAPWWQQWWFKALVVIAACIVIALLVRGYVRGKLERQRIFLEKQQAIEKERSRIASDMHDDLGAGLSTIRFLSEKVKRDPNKNEIEKIAGISVELVENMNEIIWAMNEKNDTLEDLLFYTRSYAKEYCEDNRLQCVVDFPEQVPAVFVSGELRRNVFLTVKESLHNIVKYANATQVDLRISVGDRLTVIVKDDGNGFVNKSTSGGNGLKNMRKRIESIGGSFFVLNGNGVTITMQVPLKTS